MVSKALIVGRGLAVKHDFSHASTVRMRQCRPRACSYLQFSLNRTPDRGGWLPKAVLQIEYPCMEQKAASSEPIRAFQERGQCRYDSITSSLCSLGPTYR